MMGRDRLRNMSSAFVNSTTSGYIYPSHLVFTELLCDVRTNTTSTYELNISPFALHLYAIFV